MKTVQQIKDRYERERAHDDLIRVVLGPLTVVEPNALATKLDIELEFNEIRIQELKDKEALLKWCQK